MLVVPLSRMSVEISSANAILQLPSMEPPPPPPPLVVTEPPKQRRETVSHDELLNQIRTGIHLKRLSIDEKTR